MLPETVVVIASLLLLIQQGICSPVYTMQPAYIIANIGASSGRNIRHLPCVSKRTGMSGTCMFAIDCLKANGTHLGTCIDRFYFGSCCHIEPSQDYSENVIDTALIPVRQPPFRLSSTTEKVSTETEEDSIAKISSPKTTIASESSVTDKLISTTEPSKSSSVVELTNTTDAIITTVDKLTSLLNLTTPSVTTTTTTATTTTTTTTKPPSGTSKPTLPVSNNFTENEINTSTESYKLSTFQSVEDGTTETTTVRLKTTTKTAKPTTKPVKLTTAKPLTIKPRPKPTVKPSTIKPLTRPSTRPATKPTRATTKQPVTTKPVTTRPTLKPVKPLITVPTRATSIKPVKTTPKPISTSRPASRPTSTTTTSRTTTTKQTPTLPRRTTAVKPSTTTTTKPTTSKSATTTTQKSTTTFVLPESSAITSRETTTTTITTTEIPNKIVDSIVEESRPHASTASTISNEILLTTKTPLIETVNGNTATNEIEAVAKPEKKPEVVMTTESTTQLPGLVTWAIVNEQTTKSASNQSIEEGDSDWTPITPPDGWVLLPSVSTTQPTAFETLTTNITTQPNFTQTTTTIDTTSTNVTETATTMEFVQFSNFSSTGQESLIPTTVTQPSILQSTILTQKPINMSDFTDVCGRRMYPEPRIVGGKNSSFGQWPWQISLRQWKTSTYLHKCGAALLNENWAITAAHCVDNVPPSDLLLRLGEHDLSTDAEPYIHQERRVQIVASHPQFDSRTFEYDLALLRFYEPVQFQANIVPVCVPQDDENFVGRMAHVTGWGRLYEDGPLPSVLQEVSVPVINNTVCEAMYRTAGYIEHIPNIFICAGWKQGGFDSCEGDSGGPMVIQRQDKRFLLAGIISWGIGCAEPNQPGVYTRISEFRDWINQILKF